MGWTLVRVRSMVLVEPVGCKAPHPSVQHQAGWGILAPWREAETRPWATWVKPSWWTCAVEYFPRSDAGCVLPPEFSSFCSPEINKEKCLELSIRGSKNYLKLKMKERKGQKRSLFLPWVINLLNILAYTVLVQYKLFITLLVFICDGIKVAKYGMVHLKKVLSFCNPTEQKRGQRNFTLCFWW